MSTAQLHADIHSCCDSMIVPDPILNNSPQIFAKTRDIRNSMTKIEISSFPRICRDLSIKAVPCPLRFAMDIYTKLNDSSVTSKSIQNEEICSLMEPSSTLKSLLVDNLNCSISETLIRQRDKKRTKPSHYW